MNDYIGRYVKKFESGSKGSLCLGSCGNDWGLSCGSYQLTLRWGNCIGFLKNYFPNEAKSLYFNNKPDFASPSYPGPEYCSSPDEVKKVWTDCYNKVGEEKFFECEHKQIKAQYYDAICKKLKGIIDIDNLDRGFKECFWSWAVHKGSGGAEKGFKEILSRNNITSLDNVNKMELFDLIYDYRYEINGTNRYKKGLASSEREILRPLIGEGTFSGKANTDITSGTISIPYKGQDGVNVRKTPDYGNNVEYILMYGSYGIPVLGKTSDGKFYQIDGGLYITTDEKYVKYTA